MQLFTLITTNTAASIMKRIVDTLVIVVVGDRPGPQQISVGDLLEHWRMEPSLVM